MAAERCPLADRGGDVRRVLILGGGFAGLETAVRLEKLLRGDPSVAITLVNRENFSLFTPLLHEVAGSDVDLTHIVNPIRRVLKRAHFFAGEVDAIDLEARRVRVRHGFESHCHELEYDHLVIALGSVTHFFGLPGLEQRAMTMKSLGDAIHLRNRAISHLEEADTHCAASNREALLTFVVAGGGFAGVETIAALNDFVRDALRCYPNLRQEDLRFVLVHPGEYILPELGEQLGRYAGEKLAARGVEVLAGRRVVSTGDREVELSDGTRIPLGTLVWTAGTTPHPIVQGLPCAIQRGRIVVDACLRVAEWPGVWALGDCASVPDASSGKSCPPTAQHSLRQGRLLAENLVATLRGRAPRPFAYRSVGQLAAIGRRTGVARVFGVRFSGFLAWWLWRTVYLGKLPRLEKKVRVAMDWTLDLLFSKDLVQFETVRATALSSASADDR